MKISTFISIIGGFLAAIASLFWVGAFLNRNFPDAPVIHTPSHWATAPLVITGVLIFVAGVVFVISFGDEVDL